MKVGVLALQGDVREHVEILRSLDVAALPVRTAEDLAMVDALVLPGGESTTIGFLLAEQGMDEALRTRLQQGMPAFGTCAGAILLSREVRGGDVAPLGALDVAVRRNAYGRQVDSFEGGVDVRGAGRLHAVFIRAPVIEELGPGVEVLGEHDGRPVVVRERHVLAATFHPEIASEDALHRYFLEDVCGR